MTNMKKILKFSLIGAAIFNMALAGNKDRTGQAGASELLINPWARSSGWCGLNTANIHGLEAMNQNPAGLAFTTKTEVIFAHTNWLSGAGININSFGLSQRVGDNGGVIGLDVMSISFGDIPITTTNNPEGGLGTYHPQFINVGFGYGKVFSNSIYVGFIARGVSESISDVNATGLAFDAGVQYQTGTDNNMKFGIALRNIGTPMRFGGDGLTVRNTVPNGSYTINYDSRSQKFELPSMLNIGGSYDLHFGTTQRLTLAGNFTSNSFSQDQIGVGAEFAMKEKFIVRGGYNYQKKLTSSTDRTTLLTGISAGFTIDMPLKKDGGPSVGLDYSYRTTNPFNGVHSVGVRLAL